MIQPADGHGAAQHIAVMPQIFLHQHGKKPLHFIKAVRIGKLDGTGQQVAKRRNADGPVFRVRFAALKRNVEQPVQFIMPFRIPHQLAEPQNPQTTQDTILIHRSVCLGAFLSKNLEIPPLVRNLAACDTEKRCNLLIAHQLFAVVMKQHFLCDLIP